MATFRTLAALIVTTSCVGASAQAPVPPSVALVETYADGRINYEIVSGKPAWMWTPQFPRVEGFTPRNGKLPVKAVKIDRVLAGSNINVVVSVIRGDTREEMPVARVTVTSASPVIVTELAKFGVQPITLSMASIAPMTPYLPIVTSVSSQIEISYVELYNAPYPGYRITLRNLSQQAVSNIHFQSYRGEEKAISGLKRAENGRPLLTPGGSYTFDLNLTSGGANPVMPAGTWSPRPLDMIELESIRWEDGHHDGRPPFPSVEPVIEADGGRRLQITRLMDAFRDTMKQPGSGNELLAALKARIAALPDADADQLMGAQAAMRAVKAAALGDLQRFGSSPSRFATHAVEEWLALMLKRYEAWLRRLAA